MIFSKRKTIGIFISKGFKPFDDAFFLALDRESKNFDYDVVVFTAAGYYQASNEYDIQEKNILTYASAKKLDGIIAVPSSFQKGEFRDMVYDFLRKRTDCPVVVVREENDEFNCICTDNNESERAIVRHLIEVHGLKKICFQAGHLGHPESKIRLAAFKQEMSEHGLSVSEKDVCEGNMWTSSGDVAYDAFFHDPENIPEAVVCANDYMAMGLIRELQKNGFNVPQDVIVTGFDNIDDWCLDVPALTTVQPDFDRMVTEAIKLIDEFIKGKKIDDRKTKIIVSGRPIYSESCGCGKRQDGFYRRLSEKTVKILEAGNDQDAAMNNMCIDFCACNNIEGIHKVMINKQIMSPIVKDHYICLFGTSGNFLEQKDDNLCLVHALKDHSDMGIPMMVFDSDQLIPPLAENEDEAQVFYLKLLHQNGHNFGYSIVHYDAGMVPSRCFIQAHVLLSVALENMHRRKELLELYKERMFSSITDMQTGLLNRRGFNEQIEPLWDLLVGDEVAFICFDLDDLKYINDNYGHAGGDFAINLVGKAILETIGSESLGARIGGDEFIVFLTDASNGAVEIFMDRFQKKLAALNAEASCQFTVSASAGYEVVLLDENVTIQSCIRASDEKLYKEKEKRKSIDPPPKGGGLEER